MTTKTIILYDKFFTYKDQLGAIGHEASHFIFQKLTDLDITEFEQLSGWSIETKDRKVYVIPPKNPLMPDSVLNNEEDFTNHAEMYISNPLKLKKINPQMYDFFLKRFPMKKLNFLLLFLISACSSIGERTKNKYLILNELWEKHSTKSEVVVTLGGGFTEVDSGIVYSYPNSKRPELGLFFDSSDRLTEQFVFMSEQALEQFKSTIDCKWHETEEKKTLLTTRE